MFTFVLEMNNTRFATAIHIMTLLADHPEDWLGSDYIAGSININPVMVRKEIGVLTQAGLVTSRRGKEGGTQLSRPSDKITLDEIFEAVKNSEILGKKNQNPNPKCPIGRQINHQLDVLSQETENLVTSFLKNKTLAEFSHQF